MVIFSATDRYPVTIVQSRIYLCPCPYIFRCGARIFEALSGRRSPDLARDGVSSIHLRFVSLHPTPTPCPHIFGFADDQWRDTPLSATTLPEPTFLPLSAELILLSGTNSKCSKCVASVRPFPWRCSSADPVTSCHYMRCLVLSSVGLLTLWGGKGGRMRV